MAPHAAASGSAPATAMSAGPLLRKHQAERASATAATSGSPPLATKESSTNWSMENDNAPAGVPGGPSATPGPAPTPASMRPLTRTPKRWMPARRPWPTPNSVT
eukprot:9469566-Pyramimonas_sp.AAC.1